MSLNYMSFEFFRESSRPCLNDYVALWLLKLAKLNRAKLDKNDKEDTQHFYENFFIKQDDESYTKDLRMEVRRKTIEAEIEKKVPPGGNILDIGCGLGDVLSAISSNYKRYGLDYSTENVECTRKRLSGNADIRQGTIYKIPFPDESMDMCLCLEVLEHIENDKNAVKEISRLLKHGGYLISSVPYTYYWPEYFRLMGHYRHYSRQTFKNLLEGANLKVVKYLANYPNWHQMYTRRYAITRAKYAITGRILGANSVYDFKWPWSSNCELDRIALKLEKQLQKDAQIDYSKDVRSTFVLAQKL